MAVIWAVQNGNWSATSTWNGGTLPAADDDVYADGRTVTIDQDVTVLSIRTTQRSGGTAGGGFLINQSLTINASLITGRENCIQIGAFNINVNINSNLRPDNINAEVNRMIANSSTGTVNIVGNFLTSLLTSQWANILTNLSSGTVNITGVVNSQLYNASVRNQSSGIINIIGNIEVTTTPVINGSAIRNDSTGQVYITGNVYSTITGVTAAAYTSSSGSYFKLIGNVTCQSVSSPLIFSSSSSAINIIRGNITSSSNGIYPLQIVRFFLDNTGNIYFSFRDASTNGAVPPSPIAGETRLYSADVIIDAPQASDVRDGVEYAEGILTGTLIVPTPDNVRKNIPVDDTVGTAELTGEDIAESVLNAISASTLPLAVRLKNVATVQSTAAQITATT
jgi:hypothetical protein